MNGQTDLKALRVPTSATFELTVRCNLKCKMCLFRHADSENGELMAKELTAEQWIDLARQAADMGVGSLLLTGGEPMLRPDFPEIYRAIYRMGFILELYTNATLITPEIQALLTECPPHKIGVTIYGADSETYEKVCGNGAAFQRAMDGIRFLNTLPSVLNFRTTLIRDNAYSVDAIEALIHSEFGSQHTLTEAQYVFQSVRGGCADVTKCRLSPEENAKLQLHRIKKQALDLTGRDVPEEDLVVRFQMPKKECPTDSKLHASLFGCEAGMTDFCVSWDGRLLGCQMLGAYQTEIPEMKLAHAWEDFPFSIHIDPEENKCAQCEYEAFCQSCPASRYAETGSIFGCPDYARQDADYMKQYYRTDI